MVGGIGVAVAMNKAETLNLGHVSHKQPGELFHAEIQDLRPWYHLWVCYEPEPEADMLIARPLQI